MNYSMELERMRSFIRGRSIKPLKVTKPEWVEQDPMNKIYTDMDILLKRGQVYWGVLVQANAILFQDAPYEDCPGNVVFSTNKSLGNRPELMEEIARDIFAYKNTNYAPEYLKQVVDIVTDEYERVFNYPISLSKIQYVNDSPVVFDEDDVLYFTTIMFFRDYLPTGKLLSGIFPILAAPELTDISIVLPERYWTAETLSMYMKNW